MASFELVAECAGTRARAGLLHTAHGTIETPVFMPVGTQATVKGLTQRDLAEELDVRILLANTYHLFLRPGHELVARMGGLHRFMSWPRAILTDSGGYQVFSLSDLRKITDQGVTFQSHLDGDRHVFTPESTVDVQMALGSDVMMVLDECPEYPVSHAYARESMERTVRMGANARSHIIGRQAGDGAGDQSLFPIVQGSMFADLRRECAEQLVELDADGYAIGGLSVGEPRPLSFEMVEATEPFLPRDAAALCHGSGNGGGTGGIRGAGRRHDGLRAAVAECAQRLPVHIAGAGDHQAHASIKTTRGRSTKTAGATLAETIAGPTCVIYIKQVKCCTQYWRPGTTSGATLTSCGRSGRLSYWANSPNT